MLYTNFTYQSIKHKKVEASFPPAIPGVSSQLPSCTQHTLCVHCLSASVNHWLEHGVGSELLHQECFWHIINHIYLSRFCLILG